MTAQTFPTDEDSVAARRSRLPVVLLSQAGWKRRWGSHRLACPATAGVASQVQQWRARSDRGSYRVRRSPFGAGLTSEWGSREGQEKSQSRAQNQVKYKTKISSSGCTELARQDTAKPPNSNVENLQLRRRALGEIVVPCPPVIPFRSPYAPRLTTRLAVNASVLDEERFPRLLLLASGISETHSDHIVSTNLAVETEDSPSKHAD